MHRRFTTHQLMIMALSVAINFIGSTLVIVFKLPLLLDSIGTFLTAILFGPACGIFVGIASYLLNSITVDPISIYFIPSQIIAGLITGLLFKKGTFEGVKSLFSILLITVIIAMSSATISTFVFNGVTSSASSLIVVTLKNLGVNLLASVFSTQIVMELLDKAISFGLVFAIIRALPISYRQQLRADKHTQSCFYNEKEKKEY